MAVQKPRRDSTRPLPPGVRALDPNDYSFYGFRDLGRFNFFNEVGFRSGEPRVSAVEGGIFVPSAKSRQGWPVKIGGIVTSDGMPVEAANLRRLGGAVFAGLEHPVVVKPAQAVDEEVVYLGWLFDQYGHLLLESLARSWFLEERNSSIKVLFHADKRPNPPGMTRQVLEAFGIPPDRMLFLNEPTKIHRLLIPEPLYELGYVAHERAAEAHQHAAGRIVDAAAPSQQPLYLSRRRLASDRRAVVGEAELEALLQDNGFRIVHPEKLSFVDQVRMFNQHADIFACDGSAAHGVLLALGAPRVHLFVNGAAGPDFFLSSKVAGAAMTFVNALDQRQARGLTRIHPHLVDLAKIAAYLRERGYLNRNSAGEPAVDSQELRDRYDEVWVCRLLRMAGDGRTLAPEDESDARRMATVSWPVSWMLLRYDLRRENASLEGLVGQFADLLDAEHDRKRIDHYRREFVHDAARVVHALAQRCDAESVDRLTGLLVKHAMLKLPAGRRAAVH